MNLLNYLLEVNKEKRTAFEIIIWWEIRRILYNIILFFAGFISLIIMMVASSTRVKLQEGEDFYEPIIIPILVFFCNMGYTLGWLTEIFINRSTTYGPKMFKIGLYFTFFWVFLPSSIWVLTALFDIIKLLFNS